MVGRTADVSHSLRGKPFREIAGDVAGSIVAEQAGFMGYPRLVAAFGNALAPVQLRDAVLTTKAVQHGLSWRTFGDLGVNDASLLWLLGAADILANCDSP